LIDQAGQRISLNDNTGVLASRQLHHRKIDGSGQEFGCFSHGFLAQVGINDTQIVVVRGTDIKRP